MAAVDEPVGSALTIREAASACGVSQRTIRRRISAGAFPNAFETGSSPADGAWRIPLQDLVNAGLEPGSVGERMPRQWEQAPEHAAEPATPETFPATIDLDDPPLALEVLPPDRFARLRNELAEAVAAAELLLARAEADRWRAVADERGEALERADRALDALSTALTTTATASAGATARAMPAAPAAIATPEPAPAATQEPPAPRERVPEKPFVHASEHDARSPISSWGANPNRGAPVAIPDHVREEALRYAHTMRAMQQLRHERRWWQLWR